MNTHFDPTIFLLLGRLSYSHVWWFSRFLILFSITFFHYLAYMGSDITSSYKNGLYTLLFVLIADMIFFVSLFFSLLSLIDSLIVSSKSAIRNYGLIESESASIEEVSVCNASIGAIVFQRYPRDLSSAVAAFRLNLSVVGRWLISRGCLRSSLTSCSDSSI